MTGTIAGGKLAAETNKKRWGKDFYAVIGKLGGVRGGSPPGQFAHGKYDPSLAGSVGGKKSKRGPAK